MSTAVNNNDNSETTVFSLKKGVPQMTFYAWYLMAGSGRAGPGRAGSGRPVKKCDFEKITHKNPKTR